MSGIDEGVVAGAVDLDLERAADRGQRIEEDADDVRGAPDGVPVLDTGSARRERGIVFQVLADPPAAERGPGVGLGGEDPLVEVSRLSLERVAHHRRDRGGRPGDPDRAVERDACQCRHHARAVHQREALLGSEDERLDPGTAQGVGRRKRHAPEPGLPLPHDHGSQVGERSEVATRAHGALLRDHGKDPVLEQLAQTFEQDLPDPGGAARERRQSNRDDGRRRLVVERTPRAAAVEANEIGRQFGRERSRDGGLAGLPEPRGDAVDGVTGLQSPIQGVHRGMDPPEDLRVAIQLRDCLPPGEEEHVLDRERSRADEDHRHSGGIHQGGLQKS